MGVGGSLWRIRDFIEHLNLRDIIVTLPRLCLEMENDPLRGRFSTFNPAEYEVPTARLLAFFLSLRDNVGVLMLAMGLRYLCS